LGSSISKHESCCCDGGGGLICCDGGGGGLMTWPLEQLSLYPFTGLINDSTSKRRLVLSPVRRLRLGLRACGLVRSVAGRVERATTESEYRREREGRRSPVWSHHGSHETGGRRRPGARETGSAEPGGGAGARDATESVDVIKLLIFRADDALISGIDVHRSLGISSLAPALSRPRHGPR
jgi:hypothetical protein